MLDWLRRALKRPEKAFGCSLCGKSFEDAQARDEHLAREHDLKDMYGR